MALLKSKELPNGATCEYWRLIEININYANRGCHATIAGYKDQAARLAGKQPMDGISFDWYGDDFPFVEDEPQNEREIAYLTIMVSAPQLDDEGNPVLDENGNIIETNWFADAESA